MYSRACYGLRRNVERAGTARIKKPAREAGLFRADLQRQSDLSI